jgi:hypothetical protein
MSDESTWESPLLAACPRHRLAAAIFTTYRPADASLLVEHVLPSILGLSRGFTEDADSRALYFGELASRLEGLRGKLTVISSSSTEEGDSFSGRDGAISYPWLWRYVTPFSVGAEGAAVQHAKLWMLHWIGRSENDDAKNGGPANAAARKVAAIKREALEIVVSSTNLTTFAFKAQMQAGWRVVLPLVSQSTKFNRNSWGPLAPFLETLGGSAGLNARERTDYFAELLGRCSCPNGVDFVASVPGGESGTRRWGAKALGNLAPSNRSPLVVDICTPYVGNWDRTSLAAWCSDIGVDSSQIGLSWIDTRHPWASDESAGAWRMTETALKVLTEEGVCLERLGYPTDGPFSAFHEEHVPVDTRWSHAKFYLLRRGKVRRLLLTSANFSPSAWGAGKRPPRNFELGVLIDGTWPISPCDLRFEDGRHTPYTVVAEAVVTASLFSWAAATWDGKKISLLCRSETSDPVTASVEFTKPTSRIVVSMTRSKSLLEGQTVWVDALSPPLLARFSAGNEEREVPIIDLRVPSDFEQTPFPEVDPETSEAMRDALLLEAYGGSFVEDGDFGAAKRKNEDSPKGTPGTSDFSVVVFEQARAWFSIVDAWQHHWGKGKDFSEHERLRLLEDARRLVSIFARKKEDIDQAVRLPARLVWEELIWRRKGAERG